MFSCVISLGAKVFDEFSLTLFKMLPLCEGSLVTLLFHLLLKRTAEIIFFYY